jgi:hypothetical protein
MCIVNYDPTRSDNLILDDLRNGMPGISPNFGASLVESAVVCLEDQQHSSGVIMRVDGNHHHNVTVRWENLTDPNQARRSYGDSEVATENGAYCIASLLISGFTDYTVAERARKGRGFDFWLGKKNEEPPSILFQEKARLEVSGIRKGDERAISHRLRRKANRINAHCSPLPVVVIVVEFGSPRSRIKTR